MIKKLTYFIFLFSLFSCVTTKRVNYLQEIAEKSIDTTKVNTFDAYKLHKGDRVLIKISTLDKESKALFSAGVSDMMIGNSVPEISSFTIFDDGCIKYPFVGAIKLAGLTTREAKDSIKVKIKPYIQDCDIDVRLNNAYFTVLGSAGNGRYNIPKESLNIFQVLALSGDLRSFSDRSKIHVLRKDENDKTQVQVFDVRTKNILQSPYFYIQPNDIIYVQSFNGQFFGMESFNTVLGTITSTFSLGYLLYYTVPNLNK